MSSSDPLTTLGPALFIDVLSRLPARALASVEQVCSGWRACAGAYASGLWRCASVREGVGRADLIACDALARTGVWSVKEEDTRALVRDPVALLLREERVGGTPDAGTRVNWRHVCEWNPA
jgi:hypothetical protein